MTGFRALVVLLGSVLMLCIAGCGNGPPAGAGGGAASAGGGGGSSFGKGAPTGLGTPATKVNQTDGLSFDPTSQTVKVGDVVEWDNGSGVPHNVTFDGSPDVSSQTMNSGDTWQVKFTTAGTYKYHCTFHPGMEGTVTVG